MTQLFLEKLKNSKVINKIFLCIKNNLCYIFKGCMQEFLYNHIAALSCNCNCVIPAYTLNILDKNKFVKEHDKRKNNFFGFAKSSNMFCVKIETFLQSIISIWLPIAAFLFTSFYIGIAYYTYNYPDMNNFVLCPMMT